LFTAAVASAEDSDEPGFISRVQSWQETWIDTTDAWLVSEPRITYVTLQDTTMSPLIYSGLGSGFAFSDEVDRPRWFWPTTLAAGYNYPRVPEVLPGDYHAIGISAETSFQRKLTGGFLVGGGIHGSLGYRFYTKLSNSADNLDVIVSLAASAGWNAAFTIRSRAIEFRSRLAMPLFSYVGRSPEYSLFGYSSHWAPPWSLIRIRAEAGFTWPLKHGGGNTGRVFYTWDFYAFDEFGGLHQLRMGTHTLGFGMGLKRL